MKTHPLTHFTCTLAILVAALSDNWFAAGGWACAWLAFVMYDYKVAQMTAVVYASSLFIDAYGRKWPSKEAEADAANALRAFVKAGK